MCGTCGDNMWLKFVLNLVFCVWLISAQQAIVDITSGRIQGSKVTLNGGEGFSFLGVPYAAPPVGDLRFKPPEDPQTWNGVRQATEYGPVCPQDMVGSALLYSLSYRIDFTPYAFIEMSEDCLTLDIYTPTVDETEGPKPVMVYIHGGALALGSSRTDGSYLAIEKGIVAVYIQYRLGPLGWLATKDGPVKGNMGFMDQVAALKWVQENIAKFGGNPEDVTIYGESSGSFSVSLHLVSPKSEGLFNKAIMQSGSLIGSYLYFAPPEDLIGSGKTAAEELGCTSSPASDMLECLRSVDISEFSRQYPSTPIHFTPVATIDGEFITDVPEKLVNKGSFHDVDIMLGTTEYEAYMFLTTTVPSVVAPDFNKTVFENHVSMYVASTNFPDEEEKWPNIMSALTEEYAGDLTGDELRAAAVSLLGDSDLAVPIFKTAKLLSASEKSTKNLFFYKFAQRPSLSHRPDYITADHMDDLLFFGSTKTESALMIPNLEFTQDDRDMDDIILGYWTNFAKTGNPNGEGLPSWPSFRDRGSYMKLKLQPEVATDFRSSKMDLWLERIPAILKDEDRTSNCGTTSFQLIVPSLLLFVNVLLMTN